MSRNTKGLNPNPDGTWTIDKVVRGRRIYFRTGTSSKIEAEELMFRLIEEARQVSLIPQRPERTWREAATEYLLDNEDKAGIEDIASLFERIDPYIGDKLLPQVHMGTLKPYKKHRLEVDGVRKKTMNIEFAHIRRVLNLCATSWRDDLTGLTWLETAPKIELMKVDDSRRPYPLDWGEQDALFRELPKHLANMAMFKVNTGCREAEVCGLRWEWEVEIPDFKGSVFIIPAHTVLTVRGKQVKNRYDRYVVCNSIASRVIETVRGDHDEFVFVYRGEPIGQMNNSGWQRAWEASGLPICGTYAKGPHNLKHTFGRRLRAAGVPKSTRRVLLGHVIEEDVTDHYSVPELAELRDACNKVSRKKSRKSHALHTIKRKAANTVAAN